MTLQERTRSRAKRTETSRGAILNWKTENKHITSAMNNFRETLSCTAFGEQNSLIKREPDISGAQILKCKMCSSANLVTQYANSWRSKWGLTDKIRVVVYQRVGRIKTYKRVARIKQRARKVLAAEV